jgi:retinol dehydrogenase-12
MTIPDQQGRVMVITGANSGIGREAARHLAGAGATVVMTGRDPARLAAAVSDVRVTTRNDDVHPLELDVSSLASVRDGAKQILDGWSRLDVLINNAGVILSRREVSADGYEMTFATNHLGHFLLTDLLLDRLKASAPSRVVNVASTAHQAARRLDFDDLQAERSYSSMAVYNRTKLANILFTRELAARREGSGVSAFAVHPGTVRSGWGGGGDVRGLLDIGLRIIRPVFISPRAGAGATVYAATAPGIEDRSGGYFKRAVLGNYGPLREGTPAASARDPEAARRLWEISETLVGGAHA